jgi:MHS family proline/betaine transporter-like MFS transporter
LQVASQGITAFLAAVFGMLVSLLPEAEQVSWGWRVPFVFGGLIGPVGFYIRAKVEESPQFRAEVLNTMNSTPKTQLISIRSLGGLDGLFTAAGLVVLATIGSYLLLLYMPIYSIRQLQLAPASAFYSVMAAGAVQFCLAPLFGALSDRIGGARIMILGALWVGVGMYPALVYIGQAPSVLRVVLVQIILGVGLSAYFAPVPALMGQLFGTRSRTAGLSVSYSLAVTIFGGFAPFIVTWLIGQTGDPLSPAYYVAFGAAVSLLALSRCPSGTPLSRAIPSPVRYQ